jgi:hypothetical protein
MQEIIIQIIKDIQSRKQAENRHPVYPVLLEIMRELDTQFSRELETMERAGTIKIGDTINDKFIKLNIQ